MTRLQHPTSSSSRPTTRLHPSPPLPDPLSRPGPNATANGNRTGYNSNTPRQPLAPAQAHQPNSPAKGSHHAGPSTAVVRSGQTPAEAYASAHQPRRKEAGPASKEGSGLRTNGNGNSRIFQGRAGDNGLERERATAQQNGFYAPVGNGSSAGSSGGSKPIFDWISRKLGGHRRASIAEPPLSRSGIGNGTTTLRPPPDDARNRYPSLPRNIRQSHGSAAGTHHQNQGQSETLPRPRDTAIPSTGEAERPHLKALNLITHPNMHISSSSNPPWNTTTSGNGPGPSRAPAPPSPHRTQLSPTSIFPQTSTPARDSILSRSESHSLQSYSLFSASPTERDRRREANNPYPSMPIQMYRPRGSIMTTSTSAWASASILEREREGEEDMPSVSLSFRTRSRSPSVRSRGSISSSLRPRISIAEEDDDADGDGDSSLRGGGRIRLDGEDGEDEDEAMSTRGNVGKGIDHSSDIGARTPTGADENASIRPLPPSNPSSPTHSQSLLHSGSASTSLLSPKPRPRSHSPPSPFRALSSRSGRHTSSSSIDNSNSQHSDQYRYRDDESISHGRQSRQDSASTKPTTIVSFDATAPVAYIAQVPAPIPASALMAHYPNNAAAGPSGTSNTTRPAHPSQFSPATPTDTQVITSTPQLPPLILNSPLSASPISHSPLRTSFSRTTSDLPLDPLSTSPKALSSPDYTPHPSPPLSAPDSNPLYHAQAPKHTHPHPIHNPRPFSPPPDNASTLTLASSTFAFPANNPGAGGPASITGVSTGGGGAGPGSIHRPTSLSRLSMGSIGSNNIPPATATATATSGSSAHFTSIGPSGNPHRPPLATSPSVTFAPMPEGITGSTHNVSSLHHYTGSTSNYIPHRPSSLVPSFRSFDRDKEKEKDREKENNRDLFPNEVGLESPTHAPRRPPSLASPIPVHPPLTGDKDKFFDKSFEKDRESQTHSQRDYPSSLHPTLGTRTSTWGWAGRLGVDEGASTRAVRRKGSEGSVASFESRWSWRGAPGGAGAGGTGTGTVASPGGWSIGGGSGRRVSDYVYQSGGEEGLGRSGSLVR